MRTAVLEREIKLYFDPRKFNKEDFSRILLECKQAEFEKRVAPFELAFDEEGTPNFNPRRETRIDGLEIMAYQRLFQLAKEGKKYVLWISPPSEEAEYKEGRMVAGVVKKADEEGVVLDCRGVCTDMGLEESLRVINEMYYYADDYRAIATEDEVRTTPIPLVIDEAQETWVDFLASHMKLPKVWQAIKEEADLASLEEAKKVADEVEKVFGERFKNIVSLEEAVLVGVDVQRFVEARYDIRWMGGGGHGMSPVAAMGMISGRVGIIRFSPFESLFRLSQMVAEKIEINGKIVCSVCHAELGDGVTVCPKCGLRIM